MSIQLRSGYTRCSIIVAIIALFGAVVEQSLPKAVSYDQWLFCTAFQCIAVVLLLVSIVSNIMTFDRFGWSSAGKLSLFCTIVVFGVTFLFWSRMDWPKVATRDVCYLNMNGIEKVKSQIRATGKSTSSEAIAAFMGGLPRCPSGGVYSWEQSNAKIRCSLHGEQYPSWILWMLSKKSSVSP